MANLIEGVRVKNPFGVQDLCSHIRTEKDSTLVISECMPYIETYAFQFWIKSDTARTISFRCNNTHKQFYSTSEWQKFSIVFDVDQISNLYIDMPTGEFWIYNTKLEVGSFFSDWSPHPEDNTGAYDARFEDIETVLLRHESSIDNTKSLVDKVNQEIINSVSRTTFESTVYGIKDGFDERFSNIEDGYGKWYLSIYNKSLFKNTKAIDGINDTERIDMSIFALDNSDINPDSEQLIDDNPSAMRVDPKGKITLYIGWARFTQQTSITVKCFHTRGTVYLNGVEVLVATEYGKDDITFNFQEGWNLIEMVGNESNFSFNYNISENPNCEVFNCLMGVPTSRSAKIHSQGAYLNIYLDRIVSEVFDTVSETINGVNHVISINGSKITQTTSAIQFLVQSVTQEGSDQSTFEITSQGIQAITDKFVVKDELGVETIIQGGQIQANAITTNMLSTDAIKSTNYEEWVMPEQEIDQETGLPIPLSEEDLIPFSQSGTYLALDSGNIYSPNFFLDNTNNAAYFRGTVYAEDGVFRGTVYATDGEFTGTVHATSGEFEGVVTATSGTFNGTVNANDGVFNGIVHASGGEFSGSVTSNDADLGPWTLNATSLYKGSEYFGAHGDGNIYLGDDGFSLSDKLMFSSDGKLKLSIDSLSIVGQSLYETISQNGNRVYYTNTMPKPNKNIISGQNNNANYPALDWEAEAEYDSHLNDLCYDRSTGKVYSFTQTKSSRFKIKFNANSNTRASDYFDIYFLQNKSIHRITRRYVGNIGAAEIVIPVPDFYVHWHTVSGAADEYWGFEIASVTAVPVSTALSDSYSPSSLPSFATTTLSGGAYPTTAHPYPSVDQDRLWKVNTELGNNLEYVWQEIENQDLKTALANSNVVKSYFHYDDQNGLILYDGTCTLPDEVLDAQDFATIGSALKGNIRIISDGMEIYNSNTLLAKYGSETQFYIPTGNNKGTVASSIGANGLNIRYGSITLGDYTSLNSTGSGFFVGNDGTMKVGSDSSFIKFDGNNLSISANGTDFVSLMENFDSEIGTAVSTYVQNNVNTIIEGLSDSIIQTWYSANDPSKKKDSSGNYTLWDDDWDTAEKRGHHEGDLWYDTANEKYYRYTKITDNNFGWQEQKATPPQEVFDDIDGKATIYVTPDEPTNANVGDLWFKSAKDPIKTYVQSGNTKKWDVFNKYTDDSALNTFINGAYQTFKDSIQAQTDQKADTWYQNTDPAGTKNSSGTYTSWNADWNTDEKRQNRIGDIWCNSSTNVYQIWTGTDWEELTATPPQGLIDRFDGRNRVFVTASNTLPTPPYDVGDLWVNATYGSTYNNDMLRCITSRAKGSTQKNIADWQLASKYTDDSALNAFKDNEFDALQKQTDAKVQTWYQASDPAGTKNSSGTYTSWNADWNTDSKRDNHVGDMWYCTGDSKYYIFTKTTSGNTNTYKWNITEVNPPQAIFNSIKGKATIFVGDTTPSNPSVGDLWFKSASDPIKTYVQTGTDTYEWQEYNKYTDDTKANKALSYLHYDSTNGLIVYSGTQNLTDDTVPSNYANLGGNIRIKSTNIGVYSGATKLANFGSKLDFYKVGTNSVATSLDANGLNINYGSININNGVFNVTNQGVLTATSATIIGTITSSSGSTFGPWHMDSDCIYSAIATTSNPNAPYQTTRPDNTQIFDHKDFLYFGVEGISMAKKFNIDKNGVFKAVEGKIGPWYINVDSIYYFPDNPNKKWGVTREYYDSNGNLVVLPAEEDEADYMYIGKNGINVRGKFTVSNTGAMSAFSGNIGACNFDDSKLYSWTNLASNGYSIGYTINNSGGFQFDCSIPSENYVYQTPMSLKYGASQDGILLTRPVANKSTTQAKTIWFGKNGTPLRIYTEQPIGETASSTFNLSWDGELTLNKIITKIAGGSRFIFDDSTTSNKMTHNSNLKILCLNSTGYLRYTTIDPSSGSSIRYKNIDRLLTQDDIEKFYDIRPVIASYKDDYIGKNHYWHNIKMPMLIAEDIEQVFPGAIQYTEDGQVDNYTDHLVVSVHQQMLIDQRNKIEEQQKEIDELKKKINKLLEKLGD